MAQSLRQFEGTEEKSAPLIEQWNLIKEPGAYVFMDSGELARVPFEALAPGHSPAMTITSKRPVLLARISTDPYVPLSKARQLAADFDLHVNL